MKDRSNPSPGDHPGEGEIPEAQMQETQILDTLGRALRHTDPVPISVTEAGKAAFTWRTIDAELAELVFDSARDQLAGVRSETLAERQLTFQSPNVEIEIMVVGDTRHLVGQLVPAQEAEVTLIMGEVSIPTRTDKLGRFDFSGLQKGRIRLQVRPTEGQSITTEWFEV
jgi:hypothetical protein